jgi:small subunit ribosomal protein S14
MAKKSIIAREKRKIHAAARFENKLRTIKEEMRKADSYEDIIAASEKRQKLPRNASATRIVRRCRACGRPKGVFRKFGLCRIHLREALMRGDVTGGRKSSW